MTRLLLALISITALSACSSVQVTDYSDMQPSFEVEQFFDGQLTAHGIVKDRGGRVIRTFNAEIDASWTEGVGTLDEDFIFDDGEAQKRIWTLKRTAEDRYTGTAGDVTGEGQLQQAGNAVFLDYTLQVPYRGSTIEVKVDDRMYLLTPDILINESQLKKFGVRVGELVLVIIRQPGKLPAEQQISSS